MPTDGTLAVMVRPANMPPSGLVIAGGHLRIEDLTVLGDVAPSGQTMISSFNLDLASTGASFTLSSLPQGVYSRVRFEAEHPAVDGSWKGAPLHFTFELELGGEAVDLRTDGIEVTPGHDGQFALAVDAGAWFANNVLDGVTPDNNGEIILDTSHNPTVAATIASRVASSFTLQATAPVK